MRKIDLTVEICGSAGDGTLAAGEILTNTLAFQGFHVLSFDSYPAEIRGFGKCVAHTRVSDQPALSLSGTVDILISLDDSYSIQQIPTLQREAVVLFDNQPLAPVLDEPKCIAGHLGPGMILYGVPFHELSQQATASGRSRNIVALGAFAALFEMNLEKFSESLRQKFKRKPRVVDEVAAAFNAGVDYVAGNVLKLDEFSFRRDQESETAAYQLLTGNEAAARGAIDAGCKLYAGYPITPTTKIMEILSEELPRHGGIVAQVEDEISAIGMVSGAAAVGARAMTGTSGPGLCLMTEFIGWDIMAEVPVVIIDSQRGGPATGLPTKTEQSDLYMALFAGNGDAPRIVVAPTNAGECHAWVVEALYLAEKFQVPVIILMDLFLSNRNENVILKPVPREKLRANLFPTPEELAQGYLRQALSERGVSPRSLPGTENGYWVISGLEQDIYGTPVYDAKNHTDMTEKRFTKLKTALAEDIPPATRFGCEGKADLGVMSWGSTTGAAIEAVERAAAEGRKVAGLKQLVLNPFHREPVARFLDDCKQVLVPELNRGGQFAHWMGMHFSREFLRMNQVTARPITHTEIYNEIMKVLEKKP